MRRLLVTALFLEVGFALVVVPWSVFWDRNYFAQALPAVHAIITNNFVRGAISGVGVINICVGVSELIAMLLARRAEPPVSTLHTTRTSEE